MAFAGEPQLLIQGHEGEGAGGSGGAGPQQGAAYAAPDAAAAQQAEQQGLVLAGTSTGWARNAPSGPPALPLEGQGGVQGRPGVQVERLVRAGRGASSGARGPSLLEEGMEPQLESGPFASKQARAAARRPRHPACIWRAGLLPCLGRQPFACLHPPS